MKLYLARVEADLGTGETRNGQLDDCLTHTVIDLAREWVAKI